MRVFLVSIDQISMVLAPETAQVMISCSTRKSLKSESRKTVPKIAKRDNNVLQTESAHVGYIRYWTCEYPHKTVRTVPDFTCSITDIYHLSIFRKTKYLNWVIDVD